MSSDDSVAIMCRNHRGFADAIFACAKLGASVLLLNTDFARPQLLGVIERERPQAVIYDSEFENLLEGAEGEDPELTRIISWVDDDYERRLGGSPRTRSPATPTRRSTRPTSRAAS